jgi:hypothetical protein
MPVALRERDFCDACGTPMLPRSVSQPDVDRTVHDLATLAPHDTERPILGTDRVAWIRHPKSRKQSDPFNSRERSNKSTKPMDG